MSSPFEKDPKRIRRISKFISLLLRHRPEVAGLTLDEAGWVETEALLEGLRKQGKGLTRAELEALVAADSKGRYAFSEDGARIRACQGHSVKVELGYQPQEPPEWLFHGTATRNLPAIRQAGLEKRARHHVHLSPDVGTARQVGGRWGQAVVLRVSARQMWQDGMAFFQSANGVWLTEHVPPAYLSEGDETE